MVNKDTYIEIKNNSSWTHAIWLPGVSRTIDTIIWNSSYSVWVPEIDKQHQEILKLIDDIVSIDADTGKVIVSDIIKRLSDYVIMHLKKEELFLQYIWYSDINRHVLEHRKFTQQFNSIALQLIYGYSSKHKDLLVNFLKKWWNHHILIEDMKYKNYIEENNLNGIRLYSQVQNKKGL